MTTQVPGVILYMAEEDLYRLGNSTSPRLDHVRHADVDTYSTNGILFIRANGKGISLLTEDGVRGKRGGWLWKLPAGLALPSGLLLNNDKPFHYSLCPASDMNVDEYRGLLARLAVRCERIRKV